MFKHKNYQCSIAALTRAKKIIAGGDSSTMRVLPYHPPIVALKGEGPWLIDIDGNKYLDLNMGYGPHLFGHRPSFLLKKVTKILQNQGPQLGFPTELNTEVAEKVNYLFPSMQLMRFANSGTEANASAIRLARYITGRKKIILFEGHYHGWSESLFHLYHAPLDLISQTPGEAVLAGTGGMSNSLDMAFLCPWNDTKSLQYVLDKHYGEVAAVIMEPIMGNAGTILPKPGYLDSVYKLTRSHNCLLIFDEVITGMRVAKGGAQDRYGIIPDITVISKVLGGGFPISAFGASQEIMNPIISGKVFHGGVYSSNLTVMSAASAILDEIINNAAIIYKNLESNTKNLSEGIKTILKKYNIPHIVNHICGLISIFLTNTYVESLNNYRDVKKHGNFSQFIKFENELVKSGVYIHPNMFETLFPSILHGPDEISFALKQIEYVVESNNVFPK